MGCPLPTYRKGEEEEASQEARAMGGVPLGVGFGPLFPFFTGGKRKERERERKRGGGAAPPLVQLGLVKGGAPLTWPLSYPPIRPNRPNTSPGGFR